MKDVFELTSNLIIADIEIHNLLFSLRERNIEESFLQLRIHRTIFKLVGFENIDIDKDLDEFYYMHIEENFPVDTSDEKIMINKTKQLINVLYQKRLELTAKRRNK